MDMHTDVAQMYLYPKDLLKVLLIHLLKVTEGLLYWKDLLKPVISLKRLTQFLPNFARRRNEAI
jgi:hypothetical protein